MKNNKSPAKQADLAVAAKAASSDPFPDVALMAGPIGCIAIMLGLSTFVNFLYFSCSQHQCSEIDGFNALRALPLVDALKLLFPAPTYLGAPSTNHSVQAVIFFGWFISQYALHILLPGQYFTGWPTAPVGQRYVYKVNGLSSYVLTLAVFAGCVYYGVLDRSKMQIFMREFGAVLSVAQLFAYSIAILLYTKGVVFKQGLPHGNLFVDFFHGYEPNPRFFNIVVSDLKWYLEGRALSGWGIVALLLAYQQYLLSGELTASMVLVVLFHQIYIFHYFFNETYVLGMIDFTVEHMGWGLTWGNTVLLPFGYTMPEWTALAAPRTLTPLTIAVMLLVFFLGYYIFGVANEQRRKFRADPSALIAGQTPRVVRTSKGRDLLVSGLWAYSRKPNYFGDLIVAWALGLPCMALNIAPFTNAIFLTILLIQRERRDNDWCILKYGKEDWDKYCRAVPYRIIPYVY